MTFNTKDLRDGHLPLIERIDIALRRVTNGEGQMRVPVEATDPDIVLHNCRDRILELEGLLREHKDVTRDAVAQTLAGDALAIELIEAQAEIAKLKPYALVQIAKLRRDSAIEELDGAEDEQERRQCASDLEEWHEMGFRATKLMREQWERDRKTLVRIELGDMVKAACS